MIIETEILYSEESLKTKKEAERQLNHLVEHYAEMALKCRITGEAAELHREFLCNPMRKRLIKILCLIDLMSPRRYLIPKESAA
jgi:uncharacterized lipoprotein YehR (DUF1307 family)